MAEALGIASSIVTLVDVSWTIIKYLKDVKEASKDGDRLSKELFGLVYWLNEVKALTDETEPLAEFELAPSGTTEKATEPGTEKVKSGLLEKVKAVKHRLLWKFKKESMEDALEKIERIKSLMIVAVQHDHFALSQKIDTKVNGILDSTNQIEQVTRRVDANVFDIHGQVAHINNGVSQIQSQGEKAQDDGLCMSIIPWLTDLNFKSVQVEKLKQQVGDTGHWFLESELFKKWVNGPAPSSCLWCPGNPGVGKTVLAAIITKYLRALNHERKTLILNIFCDYQSAATQTIDNIFCSLLKQLVQDNGLSDSITSLYKQCHHDGTRPSLNVLTDILSQELGSFYCVYIVLDALDEFTSGNPQEQMNKQEELINITKLLGDNIHLLVTSRDITTIGLLFKADTRLDIRAAGDDISSYIMSKLSYGCLAHFIKGRDDLRQAILDGVTKKADGMFLLAGLHMDSLAQTTTPKILQVALGKLPDNMASAYNKTLERVNSQGEYDRELAYRVFGWIALTRCPLTVSELQHALAVEPDTKTLDPDNICSEDLLGSVCGGLVIITHQMGLIFDDPIVRFVYYMTQEFFISQQDNLFPQFQKTITRTCLTYMSLDFDNTSDKQHIPVCIGSVASSVKYLPPPWIYSWDNYDSGPSFLRYSLNYWRYHASEVEHSLVGEIIAFFDSVCCGKVTKICHAGVVCTKAPVALHFAVEYDLLHITEVLLDRGDDPCQCEISLCVTAINNKNVEMMKLLLDREEIDPNTWNSEIQLTPLSYAVECESTQIVGMLLQSDRVDVNYKDSRGRTPLSYAAERGSTQVAEMLLQSDHIDVGCKDSRGCTPLSYAAVICCLRVHT
ncbi:uncharacterized protein ARMOST_17738 [Armillaria ostoyae]|uniref:Nephrocystin 3-like N-terminal domain-containing protein n=1 Tax=Armillaria ostoyae TaxID=47428 RepID=A0A284RZT6_ARMOS|nr:uncharacterized protein ARMOST_17738 [Armillaria ostoyae]